MAEARGATAAGAPPGVEELRPEHRLQATHLLDAQLRPEEGPSVVEDLPLLVGEDAGTLRLVVRAGDLVLSHAAARVHDYLLGPARRLKVAVIGAVATAPEARGRGHAGRLVRELLRRLHHQGVDLCVLWTAIEGFYRRLGFVRAGIEHLHVLPLRLAGALRRPGLVRPLLPHERGHVIALHARRPHRVLRDAAAWEALFALPRTDFYVLEDRSCVVAYGVVGKGADLEGCLHEWGGEPSALPLLAAGILALRPETELFVMSGPGDESVLEAMASHGVPHEEGALGMLHVPDLPRLLDRLGIDPEAAALPREPSAAVRALFGAPGEPPAAPGLPLPVHLPGLDAM